jgi:hypothetical protein
MKHLARPLSLVVLLLVLVANALPASAANSWSDTDPVVVVVTPAGNMWPVYVNNGVDDVKHLPAAQAAKMTYTVKSISAGRSTQVAMTSTVPCDALGSGWDTRELPSTGPFGTGDVYGVAYAKCGQPMTVSFNLQLP